MPSFKLDGYEISDIDGKPAGDNSVFNYKINSVIDSNFKFSSKANDIQFSFQRDVTNDPAIELGECFIESREFQNGVDQEPDWKEVIITTDKMHNNALEIIETITFKRIKALGYEQTWEDGGTLTEKILMEAREYSTDDTEDKLDLNR